MMCVSSYNGVKPLYLRRLIKAVLYTPMTLFDALRIPFRAAQPSIEFTVEADPPSVYYNFRVRDECLEDFKCYLDLPPNLPLARIRCLEGEDADLREVPRYENLAAFVDELLKVDTTPAISGTQ